MRKSILFLSLALSLSLAGCNNPTPPGPNWKEEEIALMKEHLSDNVVPYYSLEEYTVIWDETYECITVSGDELSAVETLEYKNILVEQGFTYFEESSDPEQGYYACAKFFDDFTFEIQVYCLGEESYASTGIFSIDAYYYNPYIYEWPSDEITNFLNTFELAEVVPVFSDTKYVVDSTIIPEYDFGMLEIVCVGTEGVKESSLTTYQTALEAQGYTISYDETYECYIAKMDVSNPFEIDFQYYAGETESDSYFDITLYYLG